MSKLNATCEEIQMFLSGYLDEELEADDIARVEGHVAGCAACAEEMERMRSMRRRR
jgi:anti-sigma factor RsiW